MLKLSPSEIKKEVITEPRLRKKLSFQPLFEAFTKYESGTGWPSFYDVIKGSVGETTDYKIGYARYKIRAFSFFRYSGQLRLSILIRIVPPADNVSDINEHTVAVTMMYLICLVFSVPGLRSTVPAAAPTSATSSMTVPSPPGSGTA